MQRIYGLTGLLLLLFLSVNAGEPLGHQQVPADVAVRVTIIYDNYQKDPSLQPDWGFACLVEAGENRLLFDAGSNAGIYQKNVQSLGIRPEEIPTLFISHRHGDHTAGIPWILELNPAIHCYLPSDYADQLKSQNQLPRNYTSVYEPAHLQGPFYSTGDQFKAFTEQGLVIRTDKGGILITGCGHPGVVEMVSVARKELGADIYAVIGGLHLMQASEADADKIAETLKQMGVHQICPTHCTGDRSIARFRKSFGEGFIEGGTGKVIILP